MTEIFAAREQADGVTSGRRLVEKMSHPQARYVPSLEAARAVLEAEVEPGAVVVTLSAGDANQVGKDLLAQRAGNR